MFRNKLFRGYAILGARIPLAMQGHGKILFALSDFAKRNERAVVGRLMRDGEIDRSFGRNGVTRANLGGYAIPVRLFTRPDGGILLAAQGKDHADFGACIVARYQGGPVTPPV